MKTKILLFVVSISLFGKAQVGGNQVYGNNQKYYQQEVYSNPGISKTQSSQNSINYKINVLNNVKADSYVITFGLNQEALTVKECNTKINGRIQKFKSALKKMAIQTDDETNFYVDFVSQTKIYDYKVDREGVQVNAMQVDKGFEIKKNIIFKITDISKFDQLVEIASEYGIYNIVKVDYHINDIDAVYKKMLAEATKIFEQRREIAKKLGAKDIDKKPIIQVNFYHLQPKEQYKNYQAFESSNVDYYSDYRSDKVFVKQEQRKNNTFYYDGQKSNYYDLILNKDTSLVGLQFVMEVNFTVEEDSNKKEYTIITPNGDLKNISL